MDYHTGWIAWAVYAADLMIRAGFSIRVIMRRAPVGYSLAWLTIILVFPFIGAVIYLMFGELRLGRRRTDRANALHPAYRAWIDEQHRAYRDGSGGICDEFAPLSRLIEASLGIPAVPGNRVELMHDAESIFRAMIADIDASKRTCHLEFYIWEPGGRADGVAEALVRASKRGVTCRVLLDAVGSHHFFKSGLAGRLREGGVKVVASLPVSPLRMFFVRFDLRLHRKIAVIDGEIAYTGSFNLVDPLLFKRDAGVGPWVDAMARVRGPAVEGLAITFLEDWELDAAEGEGVPRGGGDVHRLDEAGPSTAQVVPSGPTVEGQQITAILLTAIYEARRELVLTSPYFVPDPSLTIALTSAAARGVDVTVIVPARVDSRLVRLASRSQQGDLVEAGVRVLLFRDGLLHTKSATVDGTLSLFGSLNLDPRSLHLNYEITLAVFDEGFTADLRALQQSYIDRASPVDMAAWKSRRPLTRLVEDSARLISPLL